jgi:hypothetical protein
MKRIKIETLNKDNWKKNKKKRRERQDKEPPKAREQKKIR